MGRPMILGEAPSRSGDRYWMCPLSGAVGERLARWAGLEPQPGGTRYGRWYWPLVEAFECRNLIERYPGPQGRGAAFPLAQAREAARDLIPDMRGRHVVLLGSRLPRALYLEESPFEWRDVEAPGFEMRYAVIPHPSGLNRAYNDPDAERRAARVLHEAMAATSSHDDGRHQPTAHG